MSRLMSANVLLKSGKEVETDEELVSSLFASQCQVLSAAAAKPEAAPASPPPRCISSLLLPGFLNILARRIVLVHFRRDKALGSSISLSICFEGVKGRFLSTTVL